MILFSEDWDRYPTADVDRYCKNPYFPRYVGLLKSMGIKNHEWPMALINQDLQGVDPFDPDLPPELYLAFAMEFKENPWSYFRMVARAPGGTPDQPLYFKANRSNMSLFWLSFNHISNILIQCRQTGKSFGICSLDNYIMNILGTGADITLLTRGETLRSSTLDLMKRLEAELPFYLRMRGKDDPANQEEIKISALSNKYRAILPSKSPITADRIGRGLTSANFRGDEFAYLENIAITLPVILGVTTAARETAKMRGEPYSSIFTTTAGKKDDRDGKYAYNMLMSSAPWTEKFYDARNVDELMDIVRKNSRSQEEGSAGILRVASVFSHRQLGYSDQWLRDVMQENNATGEVAERDYLNIWTSGSQTSPLTVEQAKDIRDSQVSDVHTEIMAPYNYVMRWMIPGLAIKNRMASSHFILSIDTSDASGGDDIAMTMRDIKNGEVVAASNINETNLIAYSQWLTDFIVANPNMTTIIERRSSGVAIIDYLLMMLPTKGINPFKRLYNTAVQYSHDNPDVLKEIMRSEVSQETLVKYKKTFGFATSATGATSRGELYSTTLRQAVDLTRDLVKDKRVIDQILGLIIKNGRVDHGPGEHDDLVISWLLSFWLMVSGRNLSHYGINVRDILSENRFHNSRENIENQMEAQEQAMLREEFDRISQSLSRVRDPYLTARIMHDLKFIASQMKDGDSSSLAADELVAKLKESQRFSSFRHRSYFQ